MLEENSLVSIIMATYNRAHFISEALESILRQTYSHWECLIVDDGSTDNTLSVVQPFLALDSRITYHKRLKHYNKGLPGARNMGLDLAKGDAIIFFDDDDVIHPQNLDINVQILSSRKAKFCRYDKQPFYDSWEGEIPTAEDFSVSPVGMAELERMVRGHLPFASCTVMWAKECFDGVRFKEELEYAEEWELYSRILSMGYEGVSIDKVLYFNRKHPNSNTGEFWKKDKTRRASKVKAVKFVIDNLKQRGLLTQSLTHYFIQLGFFLKESSVINYALRKSNAGFSKKIKYKLGYLFYPLLRPFFVFKASFKNKFQ